MLEASVTRVVPPRVDALFTYPVGAWAVGLLFMFAAEWAELKTPAGVPVGAEMAIALCYPLALWELSVAGWWSARMWRSVNEGDVTPHEVAAGVRWIGHFQALLAASPAIVFLAAEPLEPASWATCASVGITSAIAYGAVSALTRLPTRTLNFGVLFLSVFALPINATGAVSLGMYMGLFDPVMEPFMDIAAPSEEEPAPE